jgi:hypothetical protein
MDASISIFDVSGKVVHHVTGSYKKGYNEVRVKEGDLPQRGVLFYRLESGDFNATKKMILID